MRALPLLGACALAGCSAGVERLVVEVPLERPGILAVSRDNVRQAWVVDPAKPQQTLEAIADWDGARIDLAVAEVDVAALDLPVGPLVEPPAGAPRRTLAQLEAGRSARSAAMRTLSRDDDSGWQPSTTLPDLLGRIAVADRSPCTGFRVHTLTVPERGFEISDVAIVPDKAGVGRAIGGGHWFAQPRVGALGVLTSTDTTIALPPLEWPDRSPRNLVWDGAATVWGSILRDFTQEQKVVQLGVDGRVRHAALLPRDDGDALRFAFTHDRRVIAYSLGHVFELTTGSTRSVDRRADYPARMVALIEPSPTLRLAIDADAVVHHHRGGAWVAETRMLPEVDRLYAVDGRAYALSDSALFRRGEDGQWAQLVDPFPTIDKTGVADLGDGQLVLTGGAGLLAIQSDLRGWCTVAVGNTRYLHDLEVRGAHGVAFEYEGEDVAAYPSILYWVDIPR